MRQRLFIPAKEFSGGLDSSGTSTGSGTPPTISEVAAAAGVEVTGFLYEASGDDVSHFMMIPSDWDRSQDIYVRVIWACDGTTATHGVTWVFKYTPFVPGTTAMSVPATALNTVIAESVIGTTTRTVVSRSPAGVLSGGTLADGALYWSFMIDSTDGTGTPIAAEEVWMLGVEFEYSPKLSASQGEAYHIEAKSWEA